MKHKVSHKNNKGELTILGIDPGSTKIGYGVISCKLTENRNNISNAKPLVLGYGYIDVQSISGSGSRLVQLYNDLSVIFKQYNPAAIAIENIYFFKNSKTFGAVTQSKGVILFTAAQSNIKVYEYTPLQIKQTISGYGKADKGFIQKLVQLSLDIHSNIRPDDASDALATALCHFRQLTTL